MSTKVWLPYNDACSREKFARVKLRAGRPLHIALDRDAETTDPMPAWGLADSGPRDYAADAAGY